MSEICMNGMILTIKMYKKKPMSGLRRLLTNHSRLAAKFLSREDIEEALWNLRFQQAALGT